MFLRCAFIIMIIISIIRIIDFSVTLINHKKQMKTRNYDMKSVLDRWENAEKQFQEENKIETTDVTKESPTTVKKRSYSYCATKFNLDIVDTDEFNNIIKSLESKDKKPSLTVLDLPTNVKDSCSQQNIT